MITKKNHIWRQKAKGIFKCERCGIWKVVKPRKAKQGETLKEKNRKEKAKYFRDNFEDKTTSKTNCFKLSKD